jgi:predicted amidohydrolase
MISMSEGPGRGCLAHDDRRPIVIRVALASTPLLSRMDEAVVAVVEAIEQASALGADIVCLPEACLPGHRVQADTVPSYTQQQLGEAVAEAADAARRYRVATVVGTERVTPAGIQIASIVIDRDGEILGQQVKTQLDPEEEQFYVPGRGRSVFTTAGITFGISICHEGFRHPETVRWAARAGAQLVFHPHYCGDNTTAQWPRQWCDPAGSYHEKAILCRAVENSVYIASCNYALSNQSSATCIVNPDGSLAARLDYGCQALLVHELDQALATRQMAVRYAPERDEYRA